MVKYHTAFFSYFAAGNIEDGNVRKCKEIDDWLNSFKGSIEIKGYKSVGGSSVIITVSENII